MGKVVAQNSGRYRPPYPMVMRTNGLPGAVA
jgi:hypothetical protein